MAQNGIYYGLELAGLEGWPRLSLLFLACFTVGLDVSVWVGLNLLVLLNKTRVFDILSGCTAGEIRFHLLPQSVLLHVWKECRQK